MRYMFYVHKKWEFTHSLISVMNKTRDNKDFSFFPQNLHPLPWPYTTFNAVGPYVGSLSYGSSDRQKSREPDDTPVRPDDKHSSSSSLLQWWQCKQGWSYNPPHQSHLNRMRSELNRPVREPSQGSLGTRQTRSQARAGTCTRIGTQRDHPLFQRGSWSVN